MLIEALLISPTAVGKRLHSMAPMAGRFIKVPTHGIYRHMEHRVRQGDKGGDGRSAPHHLITCWNPRKSSTWWCLSDGNSPWRAFTKPEISSLSACGTGFYIQACCCTTSTSRRTRRAARSCELEALAPRSARAIPGARHAAGDRPAAGQIHPNNIKR